MNILAFDTGNMASGVAIVSTDYELLWFGKYDNVILLTSLLPEQIDKYKPKRVVLEEISSYGMAVGASVFDTARWIGRQMQWLADRYAYLDKEVSPLDYTVELVKRKRYITELCGDPKAKDKNVKAYLIERFAPNTSNYGKGTKRNPGFFYGVSNDSWSAIAIGFWYADKINGNISHT